MFRSIYVRIAAVGLALFIAGLLLGADTTYYWDLKGLHSAKASAQEIETKAFPGLTDMGTDKHHRQVLQGDIDSFTRLELNVASATVEITHSDRFSLEIASRDLSKFTYSNQNGLCKITEEPQLLTWKVFGISLVEEGDLIRLSVPRGVTLSSANVTVASGELTARQVSSETFSVDLASGEVNFENIATGTLDLRCASGDIRMADVSAKTLTVFVASGAVEGSGLHTQGMSVQLTSGDATLAGEFLGNNTLRVTSGMLTLRVAGSREDYNTKTSVLSGDIWVDGQHNPGSMINAQAPHSLDVSITSGTARVEFGK